MELYPKRAYKAVERAIKATGTTDIEKVCQHLEKQAKRQNALFPDDHMVEVWGIYTTNDVKAIINDLAAKEIKQ